MNKLLPALSLIIYFSFFALVTKAQSNIPASNIIYPTPQFYKLNSTTNTLIPTNNKGAVSSVIYKKTLARNYAGGYGDGLSAVAGFVHPYSVVTGVVNTVITGVLPVVTTSMSTGTIFSCAGSASVNLQQFTVSGSNLAGNITASAPAGFELSLNAANGYGTAVALTQAGGTVSNAILYVRAAASAATGNISGNVTLSSPGVMGQTVKVSAVIYAVPVINTVPNQVVNNGDYTLPVNFTGTANSYVWYNNTSGIGLAANGIDNIKPFVAVNTGTTPITATVTATPVSFATSYVIDFAGNSVLVVNATTGNVITTIPLAPGPIRILRGLDGSKVYVTEFENEVAVISTKTNTVIAMLPVGEFPAGMAQSPDGSVVYVANPGLNNSPSTISVISATTNMVVATIPVSQAATDIAVSPDGSKLYLANGTAKSVSVISSVTYALIADIPVGTNANQISISPDGSRLYLVNQNGNSVIVISTATNIIVTSVPVGQAPYNLTVSPDGSRVFVTNSADGTVSVVDTRNNIVTGLIHVGVVPITLSFNQDGNKLYVINSVSGSISVIDPATDAVINTLPINSRNVSPTGIILEGDGCDGAPAIFTIQVNPTSATAKIIASVTTGNIITCQGMASLNPNIQQFTVSASGLTAFLTATAPAGFDISLSAVSGFAKTVTIGQSGGNLSNTVIYVRSSASATAGVQSDYITLASPGTTSQHVLVSSSVTPVPFVNPVPNQTVINGRSTSAVNFTGAADTYNWTNDTPGIGLPASGKGNISAFTAINTGTSPVTATVTISPVSLPYAYVPNAGSNSVSVIDIKTNSVVTTIPVGNYPVGVAVSSDGSTVYISSRDSPDITVINTLTNLITGTIHPGQLYTGGLLLSPDGKKIYTGGADPFSIAVIDIPTGAVTGSFTIGDQPGSQAISKDGRLIYVINGNNNNVAIVNSFNYAIINTINVGEAPSGIALSPDGHYIYVVNAGSNTVSVISIATNSVIKTIPVQTDPVGISVSPDGSKVYIVNSGGASNSVSVISTLSNTVIATIPVGDNPSGISVSADGSEVLVTNYNSASVSVISAASNSVIATIPVGQQPIAYGNFITSGISCAAMPVKFTITVYPTGKPAISTGQVSGTITACEGATSAVPDVQQFTVSGGNLTTDITASAPAGFEISLTADNGYNNTLTLAQTAGIIQNTIIFVRSSSIAAAGSISGDVLITSAGAISQNVSVSGTVSSMISPSVSITASANPGCIGQSVTFTAALVNGGNFPSYQWTVNGNNAGANSATFDAGVLKTGDIVICIITSDAACVVSAQAKSNSITMNILPLSTPSVTITASANNICGGSPITFDAAAVNGGTTPSYQWLVNGSSAGTNNSLFTSNTIQNGDLVDCIVTSDAICSVPVNATSNTILMNVLPTPTVDAGGGKTINQGSSTMLNAVTTGNITDIIWSPSTGLSNYKILNPVASPASTTIYTVLVQTSDGCSAMGNITVAVLLPIVIPNTFTPNGDGINDTWEIKYLSDYPGVTVNVFNRWGQNLVSSLGYPKPWDGKYRGAIVPTGTYYYIIDLHNGQAKLSGWVAIIR